MDFAPRRNTGKKQSPEAVSSAVASMSPVVTETSRYRSAVASAIPQKMQSQADGGERRAMEDSYAGAEALGVGLEVEDYWADELGVIEDMETGMAEKEETIPAKIEKPKDDRIGFNEGKSPFINTDKLEKRPLSAFRLGNKKGPMPVKNSYAEQVKVAEEKSNVPTMVVDGASKGSTFSLVFVMLLVTILGAAVGFVVYLAFFQ